MDYIAGSKQAFCCYCEGTTTTAVYVSGIDLFQLSILP